MNAKLRAALVMLAGLVAFDSQAADGSSAQNNTTPDKTAPDKTVRSKTSERNSDCVFASTPQSWRMLDRAHLVIWAPTQKDAYLIELMTPLQDLPFTESLAFIDADHNGMICGYGNDKIAVPGSHAASWPSSIISMRHLNTDELKALGEQYQVSLLPQQRTKPHDKQAHAD